MKIKKMFLFIVLTTMNFFIKILPIKNRIVFIHLESKQLESDLLLIHNELKEKYNCIVITTKFTNNSLLSNFKYMLNTFKQLYYVNTSSLVLLNNNNYVVSQFKREGVKVLQIWHACGAIKKFGNCLERVYQIKNYDAVIACSDEFKLPYSQAFGVLQDNVKVLGMPRTDELYKEKNIDFIYEKYPEIIGKKVVLYAPTFRGNIYKGMYNIDIDIKELQNKLGDDYIIVCRYHPLVKETKDTFKMDDISLYDLFRVSYCLISDYSSIIFDYSIMNKAMIFYVPDLHSYKEDIGLFIDLDTLPGPLCFDKVSLHDAIVKGDLTGIGAFKKTYHKFIDGNNLNRVIEYIKKEIN